MGTAFNRKHGKPTSETGQFAHGGSVWSKVVSFKAAIDATTWRLHQASRYWKLWRQSCSPRPCGGGGLESKK